MAEKRTEVTTETSERLEVLELDRTPRAEKLAREAALLEGATEVRYHERAFRARHPDSIDAIRARVDAMPDRREPRALPDVPPVPAAPAPTAPRPVKPEHRKLLEPVVEGELVRVDAVYRTDTGEVVEATLRSAEGKERTETWLLEENAARPMNDIDATVDDLPAPKPPAASAPPTAPSPPPESAKRSRFKLPFGKKDK